MWYGLILTITIRSHPRFVTLWTVSLSKERRRKKATPRDSTSRWISTCASLRSSGVKGSYHERWLFEQKSKIMMMKTKMVEFRNTWHRVHVYALLGEWWTSRAPHNSTSAGSVHLVHHFFSLINYHDIVIWCIALRPIWSPWGYREWVLWNYSESTEKGRWRGEHLLFESRHEAQHQLEFDRYSRGKSWTSKGCRIGIENRSLRKCALYIPVCMITVLTCLICYRNILKDLHHENIVRYIDRVRTLMNKLNFPL